MQKQKAVIIDIDGTIAQMTERGVYEFHRVDEDLPKTKVINWISEKIDRDTFIIFLTGRHKWCYEKTHSWLLRNFMYLHPGNEWILLMKPDTDFRSSTITKREAFEANIQPYYDVVFAIDDAKKVITMWKEECGLTTYRVNGDSIELI